MSMIDSFDMWTESFCFCCDKQTQGDAYCSEACRLADFEKPTVTSPPLPSSTSSSYTATYMPPAYEYSSGCSSPSVSSPTSRYTAPWQHASSHRSLTPSSSHSSLCSMDTTVVMGSSVKMGISDSARKELQSYAKQFDHVRSNRRRSY